MSDNHNTSQPTNTVSLANEEAVKEGSDRLRTWTLGRGQ